MLRHIIFLPLRIALTLAGAAESAMFNAALAAEAVEAALDEHERSNA